MDSALIVILFYSTAVTVVLRALVAIFNQQRSNYGAEVTEYLDELTSQNCDTPTSHHGGVLDEQPAHVIAAVARATFGQP